MVGTVFSSVLGLSVAAGAKMKIRWWVASEPMWKQIGLMYEAEHPSTKVEVLTGTLDKFYAMITAGQIPDVWGPWDTPGITADVMRGWALNLDPYIARDAREINLSDFFPGVMKQFRINGKMYSMPVFSYTDWYIYSPEMYAKAGLHAPPTDPADKAWNWEKMVENARKCTRLAADGQNIDTVGL